MKSIQELFDFFTDEVISLRDFQRRLRSMLGDYPGRTKDDEAFINEIDNSIELIIYTVPEEQQKGEVVKILPRIERFAMTKHPVAKENSE